MSATLQSGPRSLSHRRKRRGLVTAGAAVVAMFGVGLAYVAAPNNDWYLPGQTVTLRTAVVYSVNGHVVMIDVFDDGAGASISVNSYRNHHDVVAGDSVSLGMGQRLKVVSIDQAAKESGGADKVGGTGAVTVRIGLG